MRRSPAVRFAYGHSQCMEFVEELPLDFRRVAGERTLREVGQLGIRDSGAARCSLEQAMPLGDAPQILVGHGNRVAQCIKQDGVGGLGADTRQLQQPLSQRSSRHCSKLLKRTAEFLVQHGHKRLQRGRLPRIKARGLDKPPQPGHSNLAQAFNRKRTRRTQVRERSFNRFPRRILRQVCSQYYLEGHPGRPPVLRPIGPQQQLVQVAQALGRIGLTTRLHSYA